MNVLMVFALSYARTPLEVTHVHAILAIVCQVIDTHVMVSFSFNLMAHVSMQ